MSSEAMNFYAELSAIDNKFTPTFEKGRLKYVPWGHKGNDKYPAMLLELVKNSSLHGMILKSKTNQVIGQGFDVATESEAMPEDQKAFLEDCDGRGNSLKSTGWESGQDLEFFGGGAFFITWDSTWTKIQYMSHVSAMKLRSLAELNEFGEVIGYLHSEDWSKRQDKNRLLFPTFDFSEAANNKKAYAKAVKDLDLEGLVKLDSKSRTQILFDGWYLPDSVYYPVPFYAAASMVIKTDIESDRFAFNSLEGRLAAQYIIEIDGITDPILQNQAAKTLLARHTGAIASGKPLVTFTNSDGKGSVRVIPIETKGADKIFTEVNIKTQQKILSAHGVTSPTLVGIAPTGGLGNSSDLEKLSDLFQANIIKPDQDKLVGMINKVMRVNGWPLLKIVPNMNVFAVQKEDNEEVVEEVTEENLQDMKQVLFITPEEARERTNLDNNVDDSKIINTIILAQDMILEPLLGSVMFKEIKDQVIADTLESKYRTLIDEYARKVLTSTILHKIVFVLIYRFNNTGTSKADIDKEQILSVKDIKELRSEMSEYVGTYGDRLTKFLQANTETYPLYDDISDNGVNASKVNPLPFYNG